MPPSTAGDKLRLVASGIVSLVSPPAFLFLVRRLDQLENVKADLLACAVLVIEGVAFAKMIRGHGKGKGTNRAVCECITRRMYETTEH
ncbi:hypothetical protein TeGR_g4129 [Tetraparma gracilis]|uniref:Uncharacterized protein n=1 Tax=Tetraparma gracilis TaxID=2962635 RepID=A0ABQ6MVX8_9STRA|nr:hypothetical protein TeGR_g4129 [Tetraparma gracilis]